MTFNLLRIMIKLYLEKIPSVGAVIAAAGCPLCFPALAAVGSAFGFGALAAYENQFLLITQIFVALSVLFAVVSYRRTRSKLPLTMTVVGAVLFFAAWYILWHPTIIYLGLAGIFVAAIWNVILEKRLRRTRN
jgi:mercuric ion transport protein